MMYTFRSCLFLLFLTAGLYAQAQPEKDFTNLLNKAARMPKTRVEFDKKTHDFGRVKEESGKVEAVFNFKNTGRNPYIILSVKPSCECTASEWTTDTVFPGGSGFVKAEYETTGRPGPIDKTLAVFSNSEAGSMLVLELKGEVLPRALTVEDSFPNKMGSLWFKTTYFGFGAIKSNASGKAYTYMYNGGTKAVTIKEIRDFPPYVTVRFPSMVIQPGARVKIEAELDAKKSGEFGLVSVFGKMVTDDSVYADKGLSGSATIVEHFPKMSRKDSLNAPKMSVIGNYIYDFGSIKAGSVIEHQFEIKNTGKKDLIIRKTISSCGCTVAEPSRSVMKPGESSIIKVTFDSQGKHGQQNRTVNVIVNDPASPNNPLIMSGTVEP